MFGGTVLHNMGQKVRRQEIPIRSRYALFVVWRSFWFGEASYVCLGNDVRVSMMVATINMYHGSNNMAKYHIPERTLGTLVEARV